MTYKVNHPDWLVISAYAFMGFSWAAKINKSFTEMLISAFACACQGIVIILIEKIITSKYTYISRFFGAMCSSALVILIYRYIFTGHGSGLNLAGYVVLPSAAGAMVVEGLATTNHKIGFHRLITALLCSSCVAGGVFASMVLLGEKYV